MTNLPQKLEWLYKCYTKREFVHPDPLEFLYLYEYPLDREIVGLIASSLAYGRVRQILASVSRILAIMPSPRRYIIDTPASRIIRDTSGFKHRFTTDGEIAQLLLGIKRVLKEYPSLQDAFLSGIKPSDGTTTPALSTFVSVLSREWNGRHNSLIPSPIAGSACKRLHLYLRWMVRSDEVDMGDWSRISPALLIFPIDIHMHRIARLLGMTERKAADIRTAIEVTEYFRSIAPDDPVKYDFALTRLGIREEIDVVRLFEYMRRCNTPCLTL